MALSLRFELVCVPGGHGADDYEDDKGRAYALRAWHSVTPVGELLINIKDRGSLLWVRWIEVPEAWRRQGIGRALLTEAQRLFPNAYLDTGGTTEEGADLWLAIVGQLPDRY